MVGVVSVAVMSNFGSEVTYLSLIELPSLTYFLKHRIVLRTPEVQNHRALNEKR